MCIRDRLAAYQFDAAVTTFGVIVENALHETVEIGNDRTKRSIPKYTIKQILDDKFKLPRGDEEAGNVDTLKGADGVFFDEVSQ